MPSPEPVPIPAAPAPRARTGPLPALLTPALLALVPLFWVAEATRRAAMATLGRDQGIFQYVAWAIQHGEVDYRDVRDVNGPLVHLIHAVLLALGGTDERRFHLLELSATGLSFALVGWCIPGLTARRAPARAERAAWAGAAAVVLGAQYHLYMYWNQAQRESFCDWFLLPSLALQVARPAATLRGARWRVSAIAALSTITWFGKPTFALFTATQLAVLLLSPAPGDGGHAGGLTRADALCRFALGGLAGAAVPMAFLLAFGDARAFARLSLVDVPQSYRFIWAKSVAEIFGEPWPLRVAAAGLAASALLLGLIRAGWLPRRVLVIALAPSCAIVTIGLQHKGFGYHFHPLTAVTSLAFLLVASMLGERARAPEVAPLWRLGATLAVAGYALLVTASMRGSPHLQDREGSSLVTAAATPELRAGEAYLDRFTTYDFFPWDMRQAASYLRERTGERARVQVYGMDPYLLFLAGRRSATPYIYAYDLNADAALRGGASLQPTPLEVARITAARDAHEKDMLARLEARPPEAFVFIDHSPLLTRTDAWEDFTRCCEASARWVEENYRLAQAFGEMKVWLREDLASRP